MATLFKRNDIWYINYSFHGKQYHVSTGTAHRKLAEVTLKEIELRLFRGELQAPVGASQSSIKRILERHIEYIRNHRTPDYAKHVQWHLNRWRDYFDDLAITKPEDISPAHVENFLSTTLGGRSGKTKREYLASLKGAFNRAVKLGLLSTNPVAAIANPKADLRKVQFISSQEISLLLTSAPPDLSAAIRILVNTGMRLGELWALRWEDVDFSSQQLLIRAYDGFAPKGKKNRSIPMNHACLQVINHLAAVREPNQTYVYRMTCNAKRLSNKFGKFVRKLGLSIRLHDLRHTFASHLVMSGTPLPVVQELLGHEHITTTMIHSRLAPNIHCREVGVTLFDIKGINRFESSHPDF